MSTSAGLLAMVTEPALRDEVDRIAAAAGAHVVHIGPDAPVSRRTWLSAGAVIIDGGAAAERANTALPRRSEVFLVVGAPAGAGPPGADVLGVALRIGAAQVFTVPDEAGDLVGLLSRLGEGAPPGCGTGPVIAVIGGRGGAGASLFAAAIALAAKDSLLVDLDPYGGGLDLALGAESVAGLRWADIAVHDGRVSWSAIRTALPAHRGTNVLSVARRGGAVAPGAVAAVLDAGRSGGATVVCDLPRQLSDPVRTALDGADLVVVIASGDVRSCAATSALAPALSLVNRNVGLVVRGPSPGGLQSREIAEIVGLPLLAAMRPEPGLARQLETGGLRFGPKSPLGTAARRVLSVLERAV